MNQKTLEKKNKKLTKKRFKTIQSFGDALKNGVITRNMANEQQQQPGNKRKREIVSSTRPRSLNMKKKMFKIVTSKEKNRHFRGEWYLVVSVFKSIFSVSKKIRGRIR